MRVKVAVQDRAAVMVTVPSAAQSPLQPAKLDPKLAVAVSVTAVPCV